MAGWVNPRWADLVAITSNRLFDLATLGCMGLILGACFFRAHVEGAVTWWPWGS